MGTFGYLSLLLGFGVLAWIVISTLLVRRTGWVLGVILSLSVGVMAATALVYLVYGLLIVLWSNGIWFR